MALAVRDKATHLSRRLSTQVDLSHVQSTGELVLSPPGLFQAAMTAVLRDVDSDLRTDLVSITRTLAGLTDIAADTAFAVYQTFSIGAKDIVNRELKSNYAFAQSWHTICALANVSSTTQHTEDPSNTDNTLATTSEKKRARNVLTPMFTVMELLGVGQTTALGGPQPDWATDTGRKYWEVARDAVNKVHNVSRTDGADLWALVCSMLNVIIFLRNEEIYRDKKYAAEQRDFEHLRAWATGKTVSIANRKVNKDVVSEAEFSSSGSKDTYGLFHPSTQKILDAINRKKSNTNKNNKRQSPVEGNDSPSQDLKRPRNASRIKNGGKAPGPSPSKHSSGRRGQHSGKKELSSLPEPDGELESNDRDNGPEEISSVGTNPDDNILPQDTAAGVQSTNAGHRADDGGTPGRPGQNPASATGHGQLSNSSTVDGVEPPSSGSNRAPASSDTGAHAQLSQDLSRATDGQPDPQQQRDNLSQPHHHQLMNLDQSAHPFSEAPAAPQPWPTRKCPLKDDFEHDFPTSLLNLTTILTAIGNIKVKNRYPLRPLYDTAVGWVRSGKLPNYGTFSDLQSVREGQKSDNYTVWLLEEGQVRELLSTGYRFDRCVKTSLGATQTTFNSIRSTLESASYLVEVQDPSTGGTVYREIGDFYRQIDAERSSPDQYTPAQPPMNLLNLDNHTESSMPTYLQHEIFKLRQMLRLRRMRNLGRPKTKETTSFNLASTRYTFSAPHQDADHGTCVQNLDGLKLWMVVYGEDDMDKRNFAKTHSAWIPPPGKVQMIFLEPGDCLLMPPGAGIIHAPLSLLPTLMQGCFLSATNTVLQSLRLIYSICMHPKTTNEPIPATLHEDILTLEQWTAEDCGRFCGKGEEAKYKTEFDELVKKFRDDVGCHCRKSGLGRCTNQCRCHKRGSRCTDLCEDHHQDDYEEGSGLQCTVERAKL